ncbi:MAG TPA: tetratricopeptide repeat protein [Ignavibacteriales bacterium]|nr:tetratricopeptide repeat protein [Ignavibacteriales bacterium]
MKKTYFTPILALGLIFLSGCGLWSNFTTYFNLYYNAKDAFNDVELAIKKQNRSRFVLEQPKLPAEANEPIKKVIEKCSKLLQFNKESDYVDDALFMLGKAFFYQQDYLKSTRKFNELIGAYPESELAIEAELWIAKNDLRSKDYDAGLARLRNVRSKAIEEDNEDILLQTYAEEAAYHIYMGDIDEAIVQADKIMEISGDKTLSAEALYQVGKLHAAKGEYAKAADAFASVKKYTPSFEVEALSEIEYAKALREMDDTRGANSVLEDALSESKYQDYYSLIEYEMGHTRIKEGDKQSALDIFTRVDTTYRKDSVSGMAQFQVAKLMENDFHKFDEAKTYYNKAASSLAPPVYKNEAKRRAALLTKYENIQKQIAAGSKDLLYIENPDIYVKDSAEAVRLRDQAKEESLNDADKGEIRRDESGGRSGAMSGRGGTSRQARSAEPAAKNSAPIVIPIRPKISADSAKTLIVKSKLEMGNLFLTEFNNPDSAAVYYADIIDNYNENIYTPRAIYALASSKSLKGEKEEADSLFGRVYEKYPETDLGASAADILKKPKIRSERDPAENSYVTAEKYLQQGEYRVSISKMFNVYKSFPKSGYAPKALYSAGWIYENKLAISDSAVIMYDTLMIKYPGSEYSRSILEKVNAYKREKERVRLMEKLKQDSIAAANKAAEQIQSPEPASGQADTVSAPVLSAPVNGAEPADTTNIPLKAPANDTLNQELLNKTIQQSKDGKPIIK